MIEDEEVYQVFSANPNYYFIHIETKDHLEALNDDRKYELLLKTTKK